MYDGGISLQLAHNVRTSRHKQMNMQMHLVSANQIFSQGFGQFGTIAGDIYCHSVGLDTNPHSCKTSMSMPAEINIH